MIVTTRRMALLLGLAIAPHLAGCLGDCWNPQVVCECVGDLTVVAPVAHVPEKIQIVWNGEVVVDECQELHSGPILYEKRATDVVINDGGFGYTPPATFDLTVNDLGDCGGAPVPLLSVSDYAVPGDHSLCSRATVTLDE